MKHKLGIIGYGTMGSWHAENVQKRINGLDVALIYDINEEKRVKAKNDGFDVCDTSEELLNSDVDLVLVATPNNFHKDYSVRALNCGKNVVCEKPVCLNLQELDEIYSAAEKNKKLFTVHFNRRWDVDYRAMQTIFKDNIVGKPYQIYSRLFSNRNIPGDWRTSKLSGGGFLYDWGVHMIDQVLCLVKEKPVSVYAQLKKLYQPEVDDSILVNIIFESGLTAHIVADSWTFINEARWHLSGLDGTAIIEKWFSLEGKIVKANVKKVDWTQGCVYTENGLTRTLWPRPQQEIEELPLPNIQTPRWEEFYENVIDCIEDRAKPLITHEEIRNALAVVMASFESAQKDVVVKMNKYIK